VLPPVETFGREPEFERAVAQPDVLRLDSTLAHRMAFGNPPQTVPAIELVDEFREQEVFSGGAWGIRF